MGAIRCLLAILMAFAAAAACSLVVDTGGLDDDRIPASDAASDALLTEPEASACAISPTLVCDEFDQPVIGPHWSVNQAGGSLAVSAGGRSPPNALRVALVADPDAGAVANVSVSRVIPNESRKVTCSFALKLTTAPRDSETDVFMYTTKHASSGTETSVFFGTLDGTWYLAEYGPLPDGGFVEQLSTGTALPLDRWLSVTIETDGQLASVHIDGSPFAQLSQLTDLPGERRLRFGAPEAHPAGTAAEMLLDDVRCSALPP